MCMRFYLASPEVVDHTIEEGSKCCRRCRTSEAVNPNQLRDGFCEHNHNPCTGCGVQLSSSCSRRLFNTAPKVFWINFDRSKYNYVTRKGTRSQHRVRVDSHITLTIRENVINYRIGCIICHSTRRYENGHYVAYVRNQEEWYLYDDESRTLVKNLAEEVDGREVVMCFFIPAESVDIRVLTGSDKIPGPQHHSSQGKRKRS